MNGDGTVSAGADGVSVARSSGALPGEAFSSAFPMRCRMTPTSSMFLWTARLSGRPGRRPAQGGTSKRGIGRSGGGLTGKTVTVADAPGHLVRFVPLPGQARDLVGMPDLLEGLEFGALIGDGALDADWPAGEVERREDGITLPKEMEYHVSNKTPVHLCPIMNISFQHW